MGHYDDCYEADADDQRDRQRKRNIKTMAKLDREIEKLADIIYMNFDRHDGMWIALDNLRKENIAWQWDEEFLIQDPQILVDVLKEES